MGQRRLGPASAAATFAVIGLLAGCTSSGDGDPAATPPETVELGDDIELIASLARYESCEAFLDDVKAEALERVGPYGLGGHGGFRLLNGAFARAAGDGAEMADDVAAVPGLSMPTAADDPTFSGTNVQEVGVDEPDRVKTDGSLLATVGGDQLHLLDVNDPADPRLLSSTPLAGHGAELLLRGDRLVVLQHSGHYWGPPRPALDGDAIGVPARAEDAGDDGDPETGAVDRIGPGPYFPSQEVTTVALVDISDPTAPAAERTWTVEGGYVSARVVDGTARIVVRSDPAADLPFVYPSGPDAEDAATEANRSVISGSSFEDWIPSLTVTDADGSVVSDTQAAPCDQLYRPSVFSGFGMVSVLTADLDGDGVIQNGGVGLLSSGETVYASPTSLFVATHQWVEPDTETDTASDPVARSSMPRPLGGHQRTDVHQFAIDDAGPARYLASGSVDGRILNQFSMSEHEGHLRIAVTEGDWGPDSVSSVVVLARDGELLDEVGRVGDLGVTEQIYAVRFMGDRAYVVTFRQIDPFYTIDLSDPTAPQMLGELKIPGFSSYLHPVGPDLIAGVGQDATDEGMAVGSQVSLFDVSDASDPQRVAQLDLGEGTNSEVEYDHRAFLFWDGLAVLPFTSYRWDSEEGAMTTGAIAVEIDADGRSLAERGRVGHADQPSGAIGEPPSGRSPLDWDRQHRSQIRRSLVVGDTLLTVSDRGVLASDLATLDVTGWAHLGG